MAGPLGCAGPVRASMRQLEARAGFDLGCPPSWMLVYAIDERTKGVSGCGHRHTYLESCDRELQICAWVLDSRDVAAPVGNPAPAVAEGAPASAPLPTDAAAGVAAPPPLATPSWMSAPAAPPPTQRPATADPFAERW